MGRGSQGAASTARCTCATPSATGWSSVPRMFTVMSASPCCHRSPGTVAQRSIMPESFTATSTCEKRGR